MILSAINTNLVKMKLSVAILCIVAAGAWTEALPSETWSKESLHSHSTLPTAPTEYFVDGELRSYVVITVVR